VASAASGRAWRALLLFAASSSSSGQSRVKEVYLHEDLRAVGQNLIRDFAIRDR